MNLLESWAIVMWLVYTDGETNQFTFSDTPQITRHLTEAGCESLRTRLSMHLDLIGKADDKIIRTGSKCVKIQDGGTEL